MSNVKARTQPAVVTPPLTRAPKATPGFSSFATSALRDGERWISRNRVKTQTTTVTPPGRLTPHTDLAPFAGIQPRWGDPRYPKTTTTTTIQQPRQGAAVDQFYADFRKEVATLSPKQKRDFADKFSLELSDSMEAGNFQAVSHYVTLLKELGVGGATTAAKEPSKPAGWRAR